MFPKAIRGNFNWASLIWLLLSKLCIFTALSYIEGWLGSFVLISHLFQIIISLHCEVILICFYFLFKFARSDDSNRLSLKTLWFYKIISSFFYLVSMITSTQECCWWSYILSWLWKLKIFFILLFPYFF